MAVRSSLGYLRPYRRRAHRWRRDAAADEPVLPRRCRLHERAFRRSRTGDYDDGSERDRCCSSCSRSRPRSRASSRASGSSTPRARPSTTFARDLFGHLMTLSPGYYRDHPTGDVMSRLTNDVQTVRAMWGAGLVHLANSLTAFATVLTYMILLDPTVALLAIIPYPLILVVGQALSKRIYRTTREVQAELGGAVGAHPGGPRRDPGDQDLRPRGRTARWLPRGQQAPARQEHGGGEGPHPARTDPQHARADRRSRS